MVSNPHYLCKRSLELRHLLASADGDANMSGQRRPGAADRDFVLEHSRIDFAARSFAINHDHVRLRRKEAEAELFQPGAEILSDVCHYLATLRNQRFFFEA